MAASTLWHPVQLSLSCMPLLQPLQLPSWLRVPQWHPRHPGWQVRRKADPAKALVKEWVSRWRDERTVTSEVSYKQINGTARMPALFARIRACFCRGHAVCEAV